MIASWVCFHIAGFKINVAFIARKIDLLCANAVTAQLIIRTTVNGKWKLTHVLHDTFLRRPSQPIVIGKHEKDYSTSDGNTDQIAQQSLLEIHGVRLRQKSQPQSVNNSSQRLPLVNSIFVQNSHA